MQAGDEYRRERLLFLTIFPSSPDQEVPMNDGLA